MCAPRRPVFLMSVEPAGGQNATRASHCSRKRRSADGGHSSPTTSVNQMSSDSKRNVANILILLGVAPTVLWLGLLAISGVLTPWAAVGVIWIGIPLCFLSLLISGSAWVWAHDLAKANPEKWRGAHRVPGWVATAVAGLAVVAVIAINAQGSRPPTELPSRSVQLSAEENAAIERQARSKIEELTGKPVATTPPAR